MLDDLRINRIQTVTVPAELIRQLPVIPSSAETVINARASIRRILEKTDDRLLVVIGPCSIHDVQAAREYAERLLPLRIQLAPYLEVVMRVYFEKPRTTVGWKGLINDPDLDGSFNIEKGLYLARQLLVGLNDMGVPAATEFLDVITPQYVGDLIAWGAIGARTTESQSHRELASGLSCPVGFKNGTDGNVQIAIDAMRSTLNPHNFLSVTKAGTVAIVSTKGNPDTHIILRGGREPNYGPESVEKACRLATKSKLPERIMIDLSHGNSQKNPANQMVVAQDVGRQVAGGNGKILGVMVEGHLLAGRQDLQAGTSPQYGQSITDACVGWDDCVQLLEGFAECVRRRRVR